MTETATTLRLKDLTSDTSNANRGAPVGRQMLGQSLRDCGAGRSILIDRNGKIIAGNKTAEQAALAGISEVEVIPSDGTKLIAVQRVDLDLDEASDARARALALYDNRSSELGIEWDTDVLAALKEDGLDLSNIFSEAEFGALLDLSDTEEIAVPDFGAPPLTAENGKAAEPPAEFAAVDEALATAYRCPKCGYEWSGKPK